MKSLLPFIPGKPSTQNQRNQSSLLKPALSDFTDALHFGYADSVRDTTFLNRLIDQAMELSGESRTCFLHAIQKRWPLLHKRLELLLVDAEIEVPPHFLQSDELAVRAVRTYRRQLELVTRRSSKT